MPIRNMHGGALQSYPKLYEQEIKMEMNTFTLAEITFNPL